MGTDLCQHAHVGFLARGPMIVEYADGCRLDSTAPAVVIVAPGHDGWVEGNEAAVWIQVDFEADTPARFGLPAKHVHD